MPYVSRDETGQVSAAYAEPRADAEEFLPAGAPELLILLGEAESGRDARESLTATDLELVRVIEDLIGLLVEKNLIQHTELPQEAAAKIFHRRQLRGELDSLQGLLAEDDQTI
jgi:hypothetical protein